MATIPRACASARTSSRNRRAVKVWDRREFRDLDDTVELGTRNIKLALRRLRRFARQGAATELDLPDTIRSTANNAGRLDLKMVPERHNAVKVLLFLDIGGSMDEHVRTAAELFSAARSGVQASGVLSTSTTARTSGCGRTIGAGTRSVIPTWQVLRTYGPDYKLIFVGDAAMSPYEITMPGGSVEHWNEEAGHGVARAADGAVPALGVAQPDAATELGPCAVDHDGPNDLMEGRMFPLTVNGIDDDDAGVEPVAAQAGIGQRVLAGPVATVRAATALRGWPAPGRP